jgi:hypothetical protein
MLPQFSVLALALLLAAAPPARAAESPEAGAVLDRLARFMGGAERVYAIRTLVVTSENTRETPLGQVKVPTKTYFAFPLSVRQEVVVNGEMMAMASAPGGGTAFTRDTADRLPEAQRIGVERTTMRNPVAMIKARIGRGFEATVKGVEKVEGGEADVVLLRKHGVDTVLVIDRDGRLIETRYEVDGNDGRKRNMVVRHADWQSLAVGLRYPFRSVGTEDGRPAFVVEIRGVEVDVPLAADLFAGPWMSEAPR